MRDRDTIRRFDLLALSPDDYWIICKNGCLIALLAYIVAAILAAGTDRESWFYVSTPPVIGLLYALWMIWAANRRLAPAQRERLTRQRELMAEQGRLQAAADQASTDRDEALTQMAEVHDLVTQMIRLDSDLLAEQIARLKGLYQCLDDRERADRELIARCEQENQMLAVEIDVLDLGVDDAKAALAARLAALEALVEQVEASHRRRCAELELTRFLAEAAPACAPAVTGRF